MPLSLSLHQCLVCPIRITPDSGLKQTVIEQLPVDPVTGHPTGPAVKIPVIEVAPLERANEEV